VDLIGKLVLVVVLVLITASILITEKTIVALLYLLLVIWELSTTLLKLQFN
jgi:hypothetical protein